MCCPETKFAWVVFLRNSNITPQLNMLTRFKTLQKKNITELTNSKIVTAIKIIAEIIDFMNH